MTTPEAEPQPPAPATEPLAAGKLVKASALVGLGTALSRATGLLRIAALTYVLATSVVADGYNLANTTPNIVYELILGGVLSATLVPTFVDRFRHDDHDGISAVLTVGVVAMATLSVVSVVAAPWIFRVYTLSKPADRADELASIGVPLLRLLLPQILFYGLFALAAAVLNARRRFAAPAFAPILNNVVVVATLLLFGALASRPPSIDEVQDNTAYLVLLGLGTTGGILAMTVALWPSVRQAGLHLRWHFAPRDPAVIGVARRSGWTIGYVGANQVALAVVLALAARRDGDISAYTYAFVFFQLPHGLLAVSLMTTLAPDLAAYASQGDTVRLRTRFLFGLRLLALVMLPASAGYVVLARPLVAALLARGALSVDAAHLVGETLAAMALGLVGFSVYLFVLRAFYALGDTKTPFVINVIENALNVVLALALIGPLHVQGLALAYAGAYTAAAGLALLLLRRRLDGLGGPAPALAIAKMVASAGTMMVAVWAITRLVGADDGTGAVVRVLAGVGTGVVVYGMCLLAWRLDDLDGLRRLAAKRLGRRARSGEPA